MTDLFLFQKLGYNYEIFLSWIGYKFVISQWEDFNNEMKLYSTAVVQLLSCIKPSPYRVVHTSFVEQPKGIKTNYRHLFSVVIFIKFNSVFSYLEECSHTYRCTLGNFIYIFSYTLWLFHKFSQRSLFLMSNPVHMVCIQFRKSILLSTQTEWKKQRFSKIFIYLICLIHTVSMFYNKSSFCS